MKFTTYKVKSKLWVYPGMAAWRFLTVPKKEGVAIKETYGKVKRVWGSIPVEVTIGNTTWKTSIFPDKKSGSYLLPIKAVVRKKEGIYDDDTVSYTLTVGG